MNSSNSYHFETPENVQVRYEPAGLGTRFLAWFVDQFLVWVVMIVVLIALLVAGLSLDGLFERDQRNGENADRVVWYVAGIMMLVWGLGSFLYFVASELLLRGQTIGKRALKIRVVKGDGFQLDATSIVMRNAFRVLDQLPPMWVVPFISKRSQRAGDLVAATMVVSDETMKLSPLRAVLGQRSAADRQFRFDHAMLRRVSAEDFAAVERMLDRWLELPDGQRETLLLAFTSQLAKNLQVAPPVRENGLRFLEDLLSAEFRRRDRTLV